MIRPGMLASSALILAALVGCSSSQSVDPGTSVPVEAGLSLQVNYLAQSVPVDLTALSTIDYKGMAVVKLSDVWTASKIAADRNALEFQFVGSDGFKPSDKNDCGELPGSVLDKGYINPVSRKLSWDESLGFPGCYSVKDAEKMNAHAPGTADAGTTDAAAD